MNGIVKVLTGILGIMAVVACLATIGIIGYSFTGAGDKKEQTAQVENEVDNEVDNEQPSAAPTALPTVSPSPDADETPRPLVQTGNSGNHVHDYKESVVEKATCYKAGRIQYACECGDSYYVDIMSTGHVADDWEVVRKPTEDREGLRVRKCIYCDEIIAQESIAFTDENSDKNEEKAAHVHQYTSTIERQPSCTLAGLRKYTCSCGNFYTEMIPAAGHVASDWEVAEEATTTRMGREQRTCNVCGVLLDSRPVNVVTASPSASAGATASATARATATASASASAGATASASARASASASAGATASPSASPAHTHYYKSYVLKQANCQEKGIISYVCSGCGSSYAESTDLDLNNHTYRATVIPATKTTQGYTIYTCIRCNYSYYDNYTPALGTN